jgi:uncharacterized membrane protein YgcG
MKKHFNLSWILRQSAVFIALIAALACFTHTSVAQIHVGINVQTYVPPPWAPPYDNVSAVRYYYLPDYDMYYDVWDGQFWYAGPDGAWIYSEGLPPQYAGIDLGGAFMVLIDRNISRPWLNEGYYRANYPAHGYDNYTGIVAHNRIVTNIAPGHELVPRAFNENTNRVTFMQRPVQKAGAPHVATTYHRVAHEVPMKSISPSMPAASRKLSYGGGYRAASRGGSAPKGGGGAPKGGGGAPSGGGGRR